MTQGPVWPLLGGGPPPRGGRLSLQAWGWWQDVSACPTPVGWEAGGVGWGRSARGQVPWPTGHLPGPPMSRGAGALSTDLPPQGQSSKGAGQQIQRRWPGVGGGPETLAPRREGGWEAWGAGLSGSPPPGHSSTVLSAALTSSLPGTTRQRPRLCSVLLGGPGGHWPRTASPSPRGSQALPPPWVDALRVTLVYIHSLCTDVKAPLSLAAGYFSHTQLWRHPQVAPFRDSPATQARVTGVLERRSLPRAGIRGLVPGSSLSHSDPGEMCLCWGKSGAEDRRSASLTKARETETPSLGCTDLRGTRTREALPHRGRRGGRRAELGAGGAGGRHRTDMAGARGWGRSRSRK